MTKKTSKEDHIAWAKEAYAKLKNKHNHPAAPIKFRSKLEERVATLLTTLGVSYEYETEKLSYTIEHTYTPDFVLPNYVYLEAKGYWSPDDRRKILAVKRDNPAIDLRMVFQSPYNKISKKRQCPF